MPRLAFFSPALVASLAASLATALAGCKTEPTRPPPPLESLPLPAARASVFRLAGDEHVGTVPASVCGTTAGYCPVPAGTPAGLRCVCELADGSAVYAGRTGEPRPVPAWADPHARRP
jgi:hypothetical protein